jgi:hypothetical protein
VVALSLGNISSEYSTSRPDARTGAVKRCQRVGPGASMTFADLFACASDPRRHARHGLPLLRHANFQRNNLRGYSTLVSYDHRAISGDLRHAVTIDTRE